MIVNSFNSEFGYELIATIPYAYYLYKHGKLKKTVSAVDTYPLYYFSPEHEINPERRAWTRNGKDVIWDMVDAGIPNSLIHCKELDVRYWMPPPYKKVYGNDWAKFYKPMFVVYNRYNLEYPATYNEAFNYFSLDFLNELFKVLTDRYQVLYCNIDGHSELYDHCEPIHIEDYELCRRMGVIHINDLLKTHPGLTYNQVQLYYFSNCSNFLTMNGGGGILASYFGGRNIIYSVNSKEILNGDFGYYHLFGGSQIIHVDSYDKILSEL